MTNEGARQLSDVEASLRTIAEKVSVSREMVRQWRTGKKLPTPENRDVLFREFNIPVDAWDRPPQDAQKLAQKRSKSSTTESPKAAEKAPETANEAEGSQDKIDAEARLRAQLARLERMRQGEVSPSVLVQIEKLEAKVVADLAKITGESSQISEDTIVRHPAFRRVLEAITQAIEPCAKCVMAVDEALAKFE